MPAFLKMWRALLPLIAPFCTVSSRPVSVSLRREASTTSDWTHPACARHVELCLVDRFARCCCAKPDWLTTRGRCTVPAGVCQCRLTALLAIRPAATRCHFAATSRTHRRHAPRRVHWLSEPPEVVCPERLGKQPGDHLGAVRACHACFCKRLFSARAAASAAARFAEETG
jgi:hypothetical protein